MIYQATDHERAEGVCPHGCRAIGVELPGVYDGIAYWMCLTHDLVWHRFEPPGRITEAVERAWDA